MVDEMWFIHEELENVKDVRRLVNRDLIRSEYKDMEFYDRLDLEATN